MDDNSKHLTKLFFVIIFSIVGIFIAVSSIGTYFFIRTAGMRSDTKALSDTEHSQTEAKSVKEDVAEEKIPPRTNFAIYGSDINSLADTIIVFSFDKSDKAIRSISIPRDTYVEIPKDRKEELRAMGRWLPDEGMKINAVHSYAGDLGNEYLTKQIEDLLGIKIDYYFEVNVKAFRKIVDDIGGVEIDVPRRMYYSDPTEDLYIDLKPGLQVLDGKNAESYVRFRSYKMGDIDRIEAQKHFLKELLKQALAKENIVKSFTSTVSSLMSYVKTNMDMIDAIKYARYLKDIDVSKITMDTLPGDNMTPYNHYPQETRALVDKIFYGIDLEDDDSDTETEAPDSE